MRFAFCLETLYPEAAFIERLSMARKDGVDSIEIWDWHGKDLDRMKEELERLSMSILNMSGNRTHGMLDPSERAGFLEEIEQSAEVARKLGCPRLMLLCQSLEESGRARAAPAGLGEPQALAEIERCGRRAAEIADRRGIELVIEPLNDRVDHPGTWLSSSRLAFEAVRRIGHPRVKILYDIYHMAVMEEDVLGDIERNLDAIGYLHVADEPGRHEPGTGRIDLPRILDRLEDLGYDGTLGFEFFPKGDSGAAVRDTVRNCVAGARGAVPGTLFMMDG